MKFKRKITGIGGSIGLTVKSEHLEFLDAEMGDTVTLEDTVTADGKKMLLIYKEDSENDNNTTTTQ